MHAVRNNLPSVEDLYSSIWKQNTVDLIDKKTDLTLQILCSTISEESGVISMLGAKLFLAADHKQAIFMLMSSGKHALPVTALLPSLVKRCLPLPMCKINVESVIYAPTQICCECARLWTMRKTSNQYSPISKNPILPTV